MPRRFPPRRKGAARRRSGERGFIGRIISVLVAVLAGLIGFGTHPAFTQELIVTGPPPQTVSGTFLGWSVSNPGAVVNTDGPVTISNTTGIGNGITVANGGVVNITNPSSIATNGENSAGVIVLNAGSSATLVDTNITQAGSGGVSGITVHDGGTITMTRGSITDLSPEPLAPAVALLGGQVTLTDVRIASAGDSIFELGPSTNTINLIGSTVASGTGIAMFTEDSAIVTLNADASHITGAMLTDPTSTSTVHMANGTVWEMTGSSNLTTLTNAASTINFSPPTGDPTLLSSYKRLTVNSYVGNGGTIGLNTFLGADGSPSDRLVIIGGTASGTTLLRITNAGGRGAETHGNGILVVDATSGGTAAGAFALAGEVRAGASDYDLFRGAADGSDFQSWFLRSDFTVPPGNGGNGNGGGLIDLPGGGEEFPADPPPSVLPSGTWPIIGPELATYGVVQPIARQMGLTTLGTLHERIGDAAADAACLNADLNGNSAALASAAITKAPPVPYGNCRQSVWGRLFGQQINNHYEAFADPRASGQVAGIQTGIDVWRGSLIPGHTDTAGLYFAYSNGNVSVDGLVTNAAATAYVLQHTGSLNLNAYSIGGYWTHYGPGGWYVDAVLQGSFYDGNARTQFANLPTKGTGFTSSLEAGYPIPLPVFGPGFVLEPETQVIWQQVSFDDANDGLGPVGLGTTSGASGRLGLRGKWTIDDPAGRVWQPYVIANVWRDWGAHATTTFGNDLVPLLEQATRLEFAGGLSAKILPGLTLYAQAGYQFAVSGDTDGGRRDGVKGNFGAHYAW